MIENMKLFYRESKSKKADSFSEPAFKNIQIRLSASLPKNKIVQNFLADYY